MKSTEEFIDRNIEIIKNQGRRDVFFGTSYIQRLCLIGYNQACITIEKCLSDGILKHNPSCESEYFIDI